MASSVLSILLAEDHAVTRFGLKCLLEEGGKSKVVGEATNGVEAVLAFEKLKPTVVIMDIHMPEMNGLDAAVLIRKHDPGAKILLLTSHSADAEVIRSAEIQVNGFCLKDITYERLFRAVETVACGDLWVDSSVSSKFCRRENENEPVVEKTHDFRLNCEMTLTRREQEVLVLVARGYSNAEVAKALFISVETVRSHIKRILDKLGASDRVQASVNAVKFGLIRL